MLERISTIRLFFWRERGETERIKIFMTGKEVVEARHWGRQDPLCSLFAGESFFQVPIDKLEEPILGQGVGFRQPAAVVTGQAGQVFAGGFYDGFPREEQAVRFSVPSKIE